MLQRALVCVTLLMCVSTGWADDHLDDQNTAVLVAQPTLDAVSAEANSPAGGDWDVSLAPLLLPAGFRQAKLGVIGTDVQIDI